MPAITVMIKPASSECNMNCSYCFYKEEANSRKKYSFGKMSDETLEKIIFSALNYAENSCSFLFQGGEPTLAGIDFYKKVMEYQKKYQKKGVSIHNSIQTNGILLNDEWCEFFHLNKFLVGLSLDGTERTHGKYRKDNAEGNTYQKVLNAAYLLKKHKVEVNILTVVTDDIVNNTGKIYRFFKQNGFLQLQFIPCIESCNTEKRTFLSVEKFGKFLVDIFDLWYKDFLRGEYISIRHIENYIQMIIGKCPGECGKNGICNINIVTEADGSVYPCDFYAVDKWLLGNINKNSFSEIMKEKKIKEFIDRSKDIPEECFSCEIYCLCKNGCFRERVNSKNIFCNAYKYFFSKRKEKLIWAVDIIKTNIIRRNYH